MTDQKPPTIMNYFNKYEYHSGVPPQEQIFTSHLNADHLERAASRSSILDSHPRETHFSVLQIYPYLSVEWLLMHCVPAPSPSQTTAVDDHGGTLAKGTRLTKRLLRLLHKIVTRLHHLDEVTRKDENEKGLHALSLRASPS